VTAKTPPGPDLSIPICLPSARNTTSLGFAVDDAVTTSR